MATETLIRWTIPVSAETDQALRAFLAERGQTEKDIPKFIEDAVKWRMFDDTLVKVRAGFADLPPAELDEMIDEAISAARAEAGAAKGR